MSKTNEQDGVWRTIGGRRVFIKNGQSVSDAMKESGKFKSSKTKVDTSNDVKKERTYEDVDKEWKEQASKMEKNYAEFGGNTAEDEKRLNELSAERDKLSLNKTPDEIREIDNKKKYEEYVKENQSAGEKTRQLIQDSKVKTFADEIKEQKDSSNDSKVKRDAQDVIKTLNDEGSDFTFGDVTIEDGKIKTDVGVFMPDERGYVNRELEIPINKDDDYDSIEGKLRDWQSSHSTPDTFYDKDFNDKSTNETMNDAIRVKSSRSSLYKSRPESKEIESQGTSNRKEVSNNIQAHILDYYDSPKDFIEQMEAMGESNMWRAGEKIAQGGSYLIYNGDMSDFLDELKINPKGKKFSEDKAFDMYTSLIGRESARLYEKLKKEESTGKSFNDKLRRKAYEKYLKEHPSSKMKFNEFVKNND